MADSEGPLVASEDEEDVWAYDDNGEKWGESSNPVETETEEISRLVRAPLRHEYSPLYDTFSPKQRCPRYPLHTQDLATQRRACYALRCLNTERDSK